MKVERLARGVIPDLAAWAEARATAEGVTVADVVNRALAHERHRLGDGPRLDPRTTMPGRRGADAKPAAGLLHINQLADLAGVPRVAAGAFARAHALKVATRSGPGRPATYPPSEALILAVLHEINRYGIDLGCVAERVRDAPRTRGVCVVATAGDVLLVGDANLGAVVRREHAIVVVSLEALESRIARAGTFAA